MRHRKNVLTVAIAAAMAAPMAAQAVDVTLSGHVNRALFINDSDSSTNSKVKDNASSGTRIRVKGTGEMMDGGSAGVLLEYSAGSSLGLRYADVWFSGEYGKVSIGQGDQGGEGSVYKGGAAVLGTGHGQDTNGVASNYYTSLDGGAGRNERIRYDSPAVGPVSAAVSVGNGDQVSAGISLSQDFGGTSFSAGIGTVQWPGSKTTVSGSAGISLASGISISGAWGVGRDHAGAAAVAGMDAIPAHFRSVDVADATSSWIRMTRSGWRPATSISTWTISGTESTLVPRTMRMLTPSRMGSSRRRSREPCSQRRATATRRMTVWLADLKSWLRPRLAATASTPPPLRLRVHPLRSSTRASFRWRRATLSAIRPSAYRGTSPTTSTAMDRH